MKKSIFMRTFLAIATMAAIGLLAQPVYAQRGGGHGGGGGFHGGGGFGGGGFHGGGGGFHGGSGFHGGGFSGGSHMGFNGGRSFTGFHGGGFSGGHGNWGHGGNGWHGGHGGWHGGHGHGWGWWGYPYWGWGFGWGWPYWGGGWGYPYGYYGGYYAPYPYAYSYQNDNGASNDLDPGNGSDDPPPADPNQRRQPGPNQYGPAGPWRPAPPPGGTVNMNYSSSDAAYGPRPQVRSVDRMFVASPTAYRVMRRNAEQSGAQPGATTRPEVLRAMQRLREMPPFAREREIEVRYSQFSPEEKELLRNGQ